MSRSGGIHDVSQRSVKFIASPDVLFINRLADIKIAFFTWTHFRGGDRGRESGVKKTHFLGYHFDNKSATRFLDIFQHALNLQETVRLFETRIYFKNESRLAA
jgi:hypothetical protein